MKKITLVIIASLCFTTFVRSQLVGLCYVEYGYQAFKFSSPQFQSFLQSYNDYETTQGLTKKFETKMKASTGDYFKFGLGFGGEACQMILDFGVLKARSSPYSARFSDGTGRDMIVDIRNSNTDVGVRFGGTDQIPIWGQFDMNIAVQTISIESYYVFADGSKSYGAEHSLNGIYRSNFLTAGVGFTVGSKIYGPLNVFVHGDFIPSFTKAHPEYHTYDDLNEFKMVNEYLPKDVTSYYGGNNYSDNSIYNDMKGWHFSAGVQIKLNTKE